MYDDGVEHILHQYLGNPANFLHFLHTSGQTFFFCVKNTFPIEENNISNGNEDDADLQNCSPLLAFPYADDLSGIPVE